MAFCAKNRQINILYPVALSEQKSRKKKADRKGSAFGEYTSKQIDHWVKVPKPATALSMVIAPVPTL